MLEQKMIALPGEAKGEIGNFVKGSVQECLTSAHPFSHTIDDRGLKFGMHNPHMDGPKVPKQIFDILLKSRESYI